MTIDWTKPVRTVGDHRPVRVLCIDAKITDYPVVALVADKGSGLEYTCTLTSEGSEFVGVHSHGVQVENVPETRVAYLNIYPGKSGMCSHTTRKEADLAANGPDRLACVRVEYTEGQFDE